MAPARQRRPTNTSLPPLLLPPLRSERTKLLTQHPFVRPGPPLETGDGVRMAELRGSPSPRLQPCQGRTSHRVGSRAARPT